MIAASLYVFGDFMNVTYQDLQAQIAELQRQAEAMRRDEKAAAIARIKDIMREFDVQLSDLGAISRVGRRGVVAPKYRHPVTGDTWSGRGQFPRWLRDEVAKGHTKDDFAIP
jgi:DNA-binding protein H-NS